MALSEDDLAEIKKAVKEALDEYKIEAPGGPGVPKWSLKTYLQSLYKRTSPKARSQQS
ncbi:hypothetical protein [Nocardioides speluncae]|uniref:hypothetical protein n=1 Tax=Nocardioides speluncae TaxID=2670337 RepID=UPI0012B16E69|nr:hypothetical protein [Nocardioides speluncae]